MSKIVITNALGEVQELSIDSGLSLMEHLREADYDEVPGLCGGCCSCATCHVLIEKNVGDMPPVEDNEQIMLEMVDGYDPEKSRLSCQLSLNDSHDGLAVTLLGDEF